MRRWVLAFTAIFLVLLAFDVIPELRGGWGWRWPYAEPERTSAVLVLWLVLLGYGIGVWALRRVAAALGWAHITYTVMSALVIALAVQNVREDPFFMLFSHTVSPVQTGASTVSVRFLDEEGVNYALNRWPDIMRESQGLTITHFTTSPPGKALVHYWLAEAIDPVTFISKPASQSLRQYQCSTLPVMEYNRGQMVSAGFGMLMPLWAGLAVIPIFIVARQLGAGIEHATRVIAWWPVVPSLLLFAPTWNTLYPLLAVSALALLIQGLRGNNRIWVVGAGFIMSMMTFLNFAVLPLLGLYGAFTLLSWFFFLREEQPVWWPVQMGVYFGLGLVSVWAVFWFNTGFTPFDLLAVTFDTHLDIERNYWIWLVLHVYDMLMFAGWPLVALGVWGLWRAVARLRSGETIHIVDVLTLSLVCTIVLLDLTGITRAESARIWLFFVPFILLAATEQFTQTSTNWDLPLLGGQLATVAVMSAVLPVVAFDMNPPVDGARDDIPTIGQEFIAVDATFSAGKASYAGVFALEGFQFVADPAAQAITVEIIWRGEEPTERPYQFEIVATAENEIDGVIISEPYYWYPQNENYLTTCWQDGDVVREVIVISVPPVSLPVQWMLQIRAIHPDSALEVHGDDTDNRGAVLGPVPYP